MSRVSKGYAGYGQHVLATLRQPRWVALTLLVIVLGTTMIELGMWQLRRSHERAAANALVESNASAPAVPVARVLQPDQPLEDAAEWRVVTVTGTYDLASQILVRNQSLDSENGYDVVTPLRPPTGPALLVDRGWVPSGDTAAAVPDIPAPPPGNVTVQARLHPGVTASSHDLAGLPPGQVRDFAVDSIASTLTYPVYDAYAEALAGQPGTGLGDDGLPRVRPLPELTGGPHLAYAVQWFLFTGIAVGGWVVLLRNESQLAAHPRDVKGDEQLSSVHR